MFDPKEAVGIGRPAEREPGSLRQVESQHNCCHRQLLSRIPVLGKYRWLTMAAATSFRNCARWYDTQMADFYYDRLGQALRRARLGIWTVALTYFLSAAIGIVLVHTGNGFSLRYGDKIVFRAHENSAILKALRNQRPMTAACLDFVANLTGGAASTLAGYVAPAVYPIAIYRGWIGGIVSVDRNHRSRLADGAQAGYYLSTLLLQLIPYSLAGGAGVNIGIARLRPSKQYSGQKILRVPREAVLDAARLYILVIPLFFIASTFEFLAIPG